MLIQKKIRKIKLSSLVRAKEIAEPRNGAEQGVASNVARMPERKFGMKIFSFFSLVEIFLCKKVAAIWLKLISNLPSKFAVKKLVMMIRKIRKYGF